MLVRCFLGNPLKLVTVRRLFVTLDLPFSAVRGEDVCITAQVVNNYAEHVQAWLMLEKNETGFQNTLITRKSLNDPDSATEIRQSTYHTYYLGRLRPNTLTSKVFCIWPVSLGDVPLRVLLASTKPADGVERILRVVPEGVARAQSFPLLLQVPEDSDFVQTVTFTAPPGLVDGSLRLSVKITGDILGPIVENLDDLLKASYGCGEQNMVQFAPNTYVINYLRQTDQLTPELLAKSRRLMISGYQRQLRYQHRDGSFSAFGDRYGSGQSGSMWLTAFVARCLAQASALGSDVISIDQNVVGRAAVWMADRQLFDGSFPEPGVVFNSRLQGGSAKGEARTAYVLIALAEVEIFLGHSLAQDTRSEVMSAVDSAVAFLESRLPLLTDPYDLCIVAYALTLTNSSKADVAIAKMLSVAVSEVVAAVVLVVVIMTMTMTMMMMTTTMTTTMMMMMIMMMMMMMMIPLQVVAEYNVDTRTVEQVFGVDPVAVFLLRCRPLFRMTGGVVAHSQKVPVIVTDYYNPDDEVTSYYQIGDVGICSVKPSYGLCQFVVRPHVV
nr:hypothetical protein BaRGS_019571 [Batillaria attramentaria]